MKPTPFDPETDVPPIPFDMETLLKAAALKEASLPFVPQVGCFVWDRDGMIAVPFPNDVYFILNLGRFVASPGRQQVSAPGWPRQPPHELIGRIGRAAES